MGQKQRDGLRGGLEVDMISYTTLFSGGARCAEGPAPEPRRALKVELGRINRVKYSADNNPLGGTPVRVAGAASCVLISRRNIRGGTQGGTAEMRRNTQQRRDHLSGVC